MMVSEYTAQRSAPINPDKLLDELNTAFGTLVRYRQDGTPGMIILVATRDLTAQEQQTAASLVMNHDPSQTTAQQTDAAIQAARAAALAELRGALMAARLQQVADDNTAIATDFDTLTGLSGVLLTAIALKPILLRVLARQKRIEDNLNTLIKIASQG